jgi:hypothetical protein
VDLEPGIPADKRSRRTRVVQVDVRQQEVAKVLDREPLPGETRFEPLQAARRPAVDQGRLVAREEVGRDDSRAAEVPQVDQERRQAT